MKRIYNFTTNLEIYLYFIVVSPARFICQIQLFIFLFSQSRSRPDYYNLFPAINLVKMILVSKVLLGPLDDPTTSSMYQIFASFPYRDHKHYLRRKPPLSNFGRHLSAALWHRDYRKSFLIYEGG